ncbi:hypothetical protein OV207_02635 [Corallococcus sp. BB11-1]|uniref:hypothetical protein n=1 Tax=Corallococcus sp. BB11-1 TaxID=2996783 RepID=UPI00226D76E2|nr:hypothetical protein [Corallococcus sp. BB11-1]MCY1030338.1 hypothetical protein [Corallococcus sp. BB11-1]
MSRIRSQQTAQIEVEKTGEIVEVSCSDLTWEATNEGEKDEGMGPELLHVAEFEVDGMIATWKVWEYPAGKIELSDPPDVVGGTLVRDFEFSLVP